MAQCPSKGNGKKGGSFRTFAEQDMIGYESWGTENQFNVLSSVKEVGARGVCAGADKMQRQDQLIKVASSRTLTATTRAASTGTTVSTSTRASSERDSAGEES
eukprot:6798704-Lingulodinium_polyedra.AAC.1